jgi:hypothetical protein
MDHRLVMYSLCLILSVVLQFEVCPISSVVLVRESQSVLSPMHAAATSGPAEREEARKTTDRKGSSVNALVNWFLSFYLKRHL